MSKTLLLLVLALTAGTVSAQQRQWEYAGTHPEQPGIKLFLDRSDIQKTGHQARIWSLLQRGEAESSVGHTEIECQTGQARSLGWTTYAGKMGSGKVIGSSDQPGDWFYFGPGSLLEKLLLAACR